MSYNIKKTAILFLKGLKNYTSKNDINIRQIVAYKDNVLEIEENYAGFTTSCTMNVMSVTKSITSLLIGIAIDKGQIKSVDDKVLDYFPDYKVKRGEKTIYDVTIKHLLTMTAPYKGKSEPWKKVCTSQDWSLSILNSSYSWLYFAILALAANWTCAESSSEHVLCEEVGKGRLNPAELSEETRTKIFLGTTDIKASAEGKKVSFWKMFYTLAKEILNYYGQSVFFALLAIIDLLIMIISYMFVDGGPFVWNWKLVTIAYFVLFTILILRVPFRIVREYKRMALLDKKENE